MNETKWERTRAGSGTSLEHDSRETQT